MKDQIDMSIERAYIHVAGPDRAGKTSLIERVLEGVRVVAMVARCMTDNQLGEPQESRPRGHPELQRYQKAGASNGVLYREPGRKTKSPWDSFFETAFLNHYSRAVFLEGTCPISYVDLHVFVAPPSPDGSVLRRVQRDDAVEEKATLDRIEQYLSDPGTLPATTDAEDLPISTRRTELIVRAVLSMAKQFPDHEMEIRDVFRRTVETYRKRPPPKPTEHWALVEGLEGLERAGAVVLNVRSMLQEIPRLRKDKEVFDDVLGWRGHRTPVTAVVADLTDPKDPGTKKILARIRRVIARPCPFIHALPTVL